MTTSNSPASPRRVSSCCTVRCRVDRTLDASPVAMPATWLWAYRTPDCAWSIAACRLTRSSWSRIWLNSTRLTMITTVPATAIVMAPMRICSEDRQSCTARPTSRRERTYARRRRRTARRRRPGRTRRSSIAVEDDVAVGGAGRSTSLRGGSVRVTTGGSPHGSRWPCLVAHPAHGQHDLGLLGVALDLGPEALYVDVDQPGVSRVPVAP